MDEGVSTARINNTMGKMAFYLSTHNSVCVGVSGGSDSNIIVHIIATYFREYLDKVHFVFQNTGLEYAATKRHIDYMEQRYNVKIDRMSPGKGNNIVEVVRREGLPLVSKEFSKTLYYAQHGGQWAIDKMYQTRKENPHAFPKKQQSLAKYCTENNIAVSAKCCDSAKKNPFARYLRSVKADLKISGERQAEGGVRATAHKDCFVAGKIDKYMPLWFWNDETKAYYKEKEGIVYSDCYEVWGMDRTGCTGCPFNSKMGEDLKVIEKYEPNMYRACMNVFGKAYELMDQFNIHKNKILQGDDKNGAKTDLCGQCRDDADERDGNCCLLAGDECSLGQSVKSSS